MFLVDGSFDQDDKYMAQLKTICCVCVSINADQTVSSATSSDELQLVQALVLTLSPLENTLKRLLEVILYNQVSLEFLKLSFYTRALQADTCCHVSDGLWKHF